jgi:hypothetical protein
MLFGRKKDLQLIAMLILINIQYYTANLFPIDNDSVRFVIGRINTALNGFSGDDLSVVIDVTVAFTEFHQCAVSGTSDTFVFFMI